VQSSVLDVEPHGIGEGNAAPHLLLHPRTTHPPLGTTTTTTALCFCVVVCMKVILILSSLLLCFCRQDTIPERKLIARTKASAADAKAATDPKAPAQQTLPPAADGSSGSAQSAHDPTASSAGAKAVIPKDEIAVTAFNEYLLPYLQSNKEDSAKLFVKTVHDHLWFRSEAYCQLIKQLTECPDENE
jgi:hypothetical protein